MRVNSGESHDRGKSTEDESPGHSISLSRCGVGGRTPGRLPGGSGIGTEIKTMNLQRLTRWGQNEGGEVRPFQREGPAGTRPQRLSQEGLS